MDNTNDLHNNQSNELDVSSMFFILYRINKLPRKEDLIFKRVCYELELDANCVTVKNFKLLTGYSEQFKAMAEVYEKINDNGFVMLVSPHVKEWSSPGFYKKWDIEKINSLIDHFKKYEEELKKEHETIEEVGFVYYETLFTFKSFKELYRFTETLAENKKNPVPVIHDYVRIDYLTFIFRREFLAVWDQHRKEFEQLELDMQIKKDTYV